MNKNKCKEFLNKLYYDIKATLSLIKRFIFCKWV